MHRSGTSALAGTLVGLGLDPGARDTLMPADEGNPEGYFEQWPIVTLNDEILLRHGGRWDSPPHLGLAWVDADLERARTLYRDLYDTPHFVMKDPRVSLLLDLWRRAAPTELSAVLIVRDPLQVAWSLAKRDAIPVVTGLALWSAFNRAAISGLAGMRVHVCTYRDLVENPESVVGAIGESLRAWGEVSDANVVEGVARVNPDLRRNTAPVNEDRRETAPAEIETLARYLESLVGRHDNFTATCPAPGWWEGPVLDERRVLVGELTREIAEREKVIGDLVRNVEALRAQSRELRDDLAKTTADLEALRNVAPVRVMRALGRLARR